MTLFKIYRFVADYKNFSFLLLCTISLMGGLSCEKFSKTEQPEDNSADTTSPVENSKKADAGVIAIENAKENSSGEAESAPKKPAPTTSELAELLENRRRELDIREAEIIRREHLLENLENAAVQKAGNLKLLREEITAMLSELESKLESQRKERLKELHGAVDELSAEREQRLAHLVAAVKGMRPDAGAELLGIMDEADAVHVLRTLSARQAAIFLGAMPPARAANLAQAMLGPKVPKSPYLSTKASQEEKRND